MISLNHGSFGAAPKPVLAARDEWTARLQSNPMEFFTRRYETYLEEARGRLASFVGAAADNLAFVGNTTVGMNVAADGVPLQPGDEVLAGDHEYGAVLRIWERACRRAVLGQRILQLGKDRASNSDLTSLAELANLASLRLSHGEVDDLTPVSRLTSLERLWLRNTKVTDLKLLSGLNLKALDVSLTKIRDLKPLAGHTNLQVLRVGDARIIDLTPVAGHGSLHTVVVHNTEANDLLPLAKNLKELWITNRMTDEQIAILKRSLPNCEINRNVDPQWVWHVD